MNRMSDRELLERAAMAGGVCVTYHHDSGTFYDTTAQGNPAMNLLSRPTWNPLDNDGDALRLAVAIQWLPTRSEFARLAAQPDPHAATRRAIVIEAVAKEEAATWKSPYDG